MIDMVKQTITQGEKTEPIKTWTVWFMMPMGVTPLASQAVDACKAVDFDPAVSIIPVSVATSDTMYEVVGGFR